MSSTETSVTTSLTEVLRAEEARIRADEERARRRIEEDRAAREAEERAARQQEERRVAAETERRRIEEVREREQEARLEAIREVEIARARREAETALRVDVPAPSNAPVPRPRRWMGVALGGAIIGWAASLSVVVAWQSRRADARAWDLSAQHAAAEQAWTTTRQGLEERLGRAADEIASARDEVQRLEKALRESKLKPAVAGPPPRPARPPTEEPCPCPEGDPLCGLTCKKR